MRSNIFCILLCYILFLEHSFYVIATCPEVPNCTCTKIKGKSDIEEYKLKCTNIGELEQIFLNNTTYVDVAQLDLSHNSISTIPADSFFTPFLIKLDLDRNKISSIADGAFVKLNSLRQLILSNNKIKTISKNIFEGLHSLESLKLNQNLISTLSEDVFEHLKHLIKLNLAGNPFNCNCDILWMLKYEKSRNIKITYGKCSEPKSLLGQGLSKININDLQCSLELDDNTDVIRISPSRNQIAYEGDQFGISCAISNVKYKAAKDSIKWIYNNSDPLAIFSDVKIEPVSDGLQESWLIIQNIRRIHKGIWKCVFDSNNANETLDLFVEVISNITKFCPPIITEDNKGVYKWPETIMGRMVKLPCAFNEEDDGGNETHAISYATYFCNEDGNWTTLDTGNCLYSSSVSRILRQYSKMNLTNHKETLLESAIRLRNFTVEHLTDISDPIDLTYIVITIENYLQYLSTESELGVLLMEIISYLMNLDASLLADGQKEAAVCSRILRTIEIIAKTTPSFEYQSNNLGIKSFHVSLDVFVGITCTWYAVIDTDGSKSSLLNCSTANKTTISNVDASAQLPPNLLFRNEGENHLTSYDIVIAMYKDSRLFPDSIAVSRDFTNSMVVSALVVDVNMNKLEDPIYIMMKNTIKTDNREKQLDWWNSETYRWEKAPCHRVLYGNTPLIVYQCFRLGYFSLLPEPEDVNQHETRVLMKEKFRFLHASVYVGSFVGITCLLASAITYCLCYPFVQASRRMKHSLVNTWISISLFCLFFSLGIRQTEQESLCQIIGLIIHYFALATLFWMAVTVKSLYKRVQKSNPSMCTPSEDLPDSDDVIKKPIMGIYLVGWGISLILCGISGAVNLSGYAGARYCFLTPGPALSTVFIPASLILFYLTIMCLLVKCVTSSLESNAQLSVGTQAIDLDLLDNNATNERCSIRSIVTPSSQIDDMEHSPLKQLKAVVIVLVIYMMLVTSSACIVMLPFNWKNEEEIWSAVYALTSFVLGAFVIFFHCFARNDVRSGWIRLRKFHRKKESNLLEQQQPLQQQQQEQMIFKPGQTETATKLVQKTEFAKKVPNFNLVKLHRQHYHNDEVNLDNNFYNPHQSIVAQKFFRKQRKKRDIVIRKCRSGGSSPVRFYNDPLLLNNRNTRQYERSLSIATSAVPEYAEIPSICDPRKDGNNDKCTCGTVSDVNSEPTYNYAFIDKIGYSDESTDSHLYATVAPDIVNSTVKHFSKEGYNNMNNNRWNRKNNANERRKRNEQLRRLSDALTDASSGDRVETCV